jgi:hypothetical protein
MNAKRVALRSFSEVGYASAGFAEASEDATAVKPWSFTLKIRKYIHVTILEMSHFHKKNLLRIHF